MPTDLCRHGRYSPCESCRIEARRPVARLLDTCRHGRVAGECADCHERDVAIGAEGQAPSWESVCVELIGLAQSLDRLIVAVTALGPPAERPRYDPLDDEVVVP